MKLQSILWIVGLALILFACDDNATIEPSAEAEEPQENEQGETVVGDEVDKGIEKLDMEESEPTVVEEEEDGISTEVIFAGNMTLKEDEIEVDVESNLPMGVEVQILAVYYPYGGYVVKPIIINEKLSVGEDGIIKGSVPFDASFYESKENEPIELELRFNPSLISFLHEDADVLKLIYGEEGEHLEGPFVEETYHSHYDAPEYNISARVIGTAKIDEVFTIEEPVAGTPPKDYGDSNVWMNAEITDIDHRYVYVEGSSNLIEGMLLFGNIYKSEDAFYPQNAFAYKSEVKKDGSFTLRIEYRSLADEGHIEIYSQASLGHRRGRAVLDAYGEEFEKLQGDIVKPRYEDKTEQIIQLIIPLNPEVENTPEAVDLTRDDEEMKIIMPDDILFSFDESDITGEGDQVVKEVAEWLESEQYSGKIKIYGHTDNVSGDDINQPLSEKRAENVHQSLKSHLTDASLYQFDVEGFGKYVPIATNETDDGRKRNRRVEILLDYDPSGN